MHDAPCKTHPSSKQPHVVTYRIVCKPPTTHDTRKCGMVLEHKSTNMQMNIDVVTEKCREERIEVDTSKIMGFKHCIHSLALVYILPSFSPSTNQSIVTIFTISPLFGMK